MTISSRQAPLEFSGHRYLRQLLLLSLLSGRQIIIKGIRAEAVSPGLAPEEINLLKLLEKVTNGTVAVIGKTGTQLIFRPGIIDANEGLLVEHDCSLERSVTYWAEPMCILALFAKTDLWLELRGNTDDLLDQSIDSFHRAFSYLCTQFQVSAPQIKILKRAYTPQGGGNVVIRQQYAKRLEAVSLVDEGKVKRVRGWVTSAKVAPALTSRVIDSLRGVFNDYIPDVWIHTDHYKKDQSGPQPGFAVSLQAETTTGVCYTKDFMFSEKFKMPEDLGEHAAQSMLDEIFTGGVVDSCNQPTLLLMTALSAGDTVSSIKLARLTEQSIALLRHLKTFFNIEFQIHECEDDVFADESASSSDGEDVVNEITNLQDEKFQFPKAFVFSCIGIELTNFARKAD